VNLYERITRHLRRPISPRIEPDYEWSGGHVLIERSHYRIICGGCGSDPGSDCDAVGTVQRYLVPTKPYATWSADDRERVEAWRSLLSPPFTHRVCLSYRLSEGEYRSILSVSLNLSGTLYSASTVAKRLGAFLQYQLQEVTNRWFLFKGLSAQLFWLRAIERKYVDLAKGGNDIEEEHPPGQPKRTALGIDRLKLPPGKRNGRSPL
jgi:hypothetical protein